MTDAALEAQPFPASRALAAQTTGIYFGLPEDEYHADPALSQSGIKDLMVSPFLYWANSRLNPDRQNNDSEAKRVGTAYHARIIEGRAVFYQRYAVALDPTDLSDALVTQSDLRARLKELELPLGGTKAEQIDRLLAADPEAQVWDRLLQDHAAGNAGKEMLPFELVKKIEIAAKMIEAHPDLCSAFAGGFPEVSIFWQCAETGIPMKARLDYLKPSTIVDLKTFTNPRGQNLSNLIKRRIASEGYYVQCAHYLEAVAAAKRMIKDRGFSAVHGGGPGEDLIRWANAPEPTFFFIFQQQRVPTTRGLRFGRDHAGSTLAAGEMLIDRMKRRWRRYWQTFGAEPWVDLATLEDYADGDAPDFYFTDYGDDDE